MATGKERVPARVMRMVQELGLGSVRVQERALVPALTLVLVRSFNLHAV
jgi:hypothetical protein